VKETGLFFGSFNPIHTGHLIIAQYMLEKLDLEEVRFVVSPQNPFKDPHDLYPEQARLDLVQKAIRSNPRFRCSAIEFSLPRPSYTFQTLEYLEENEPGKRFCIIMGSDNLDKLDMWKHSEQILNQYRIHIYQRPGYKIKRRLHAHITLHDAPFLYISATYIRDIIREGRSARYLVPDEILQDVQKLG
jgi:nicotinate-nucleotide adenylyltransferase